MNWKFSAVLAFAVAVGGGGVSDSQALPRCSITCLCHDSKEWEKWEETELERVGKMMEEEKKKEQEEREKERREGGRKDPCGRQHGDQPSPK